MWKDFGGLVLWRRWKHPGLGFLSLGRGVASVIALSLASLVPTVSLREMQNVTHLPRVLVLASEGTPTCSASAMRNPPSSHSCDIFNNRNFHRHVLIELRDKSDLP